MPWHEFWSDAKPADVEYLDPGERYSYLADPLSRLVRMKVSHNSAAPNALAFAGPMHELAISGEGVMEGPDGSWGRVVDPSRRDKGLIDWYVKNPTFFGSHYHRQIEYTYVKQGAIRFTGHGWNCLVKPGEFIQILPYVEHDCEVYGESAFEVLFVPALGYKVVPT